MHRSDSARPDRSLRLARPVTARPVTARAPAPPGELPDELSDEPPGGADAPRGVVYGDAGLRPLADAPTLSPAATSRWPRTFEPRTDGGAHSRDPHRQDPRTGWQRVLSAFPPGTLQEIETAQRACTVLQSLAAHEARPDGDDADVRARTLLQIAARLEGLVPQVEHLAHLIGRLRP